MYFIKKVFIKHPFVNLFMFRFNISKADSVINLRIRYTFVHEFRMKHLKIQVYILLPSPTPKMFVFVVRFFMHKFLLFSPLDLESGILD